MALCRDKLDDLVRTWMDNCSARYGFTETLSLDEYLMEYGEKLDDEDRSAGHQMLGLYHEYGGTM